MYTYKPRLTDKVVQIMDMMCGDFVTAAPLYTQNKLCVVQYNKNFVSIKSENLNA